MHNLIKFEYRKLWNKVSCVTIAALIILSSLHTFIYLNIQWRTIDPSGEVVNGLGAYRTLMDSAEDIEGIMDEKYLNDLIENYAVSVDKKYMDEHRGFLGTGGMTKYMFPNYCINYAYYGLYMSNGNDKIGLDYEFLNSAGDFYQTYKKAALDHILYLNEYTGITKFTEQQKTLIEKKVMDIKTPYTIKYYQGISNLMNWYNLEYPIFFIALAFILACIYSKDSSSGINELTLSTNNGRKKDFIARSLAGNLFTITSYFIFIGVLIIEHGAIATLHGWNASAQTYWYDCIFNISIGTGLLLKLAGGLFGSLVIGNLIMLLSMKVKNTKITTILSLGLVIMLIKLSTTYSQIKLFYPLQFSSDAIVKSFFMIGGILIPYYIVIVILATLYIAFMFLLMLKNANKYYLN